MEEYLNRVVCGDCQNVLKTLPENSVDSICCDPPYELGFMGKSWDNTGIANNVEMWKECLRVLKPGGHLLAFSGTRTYHRMAVAIEDAGFEVRDMIEWVYGSGFPKSLNIGKAVDKLQGNEREIVGKNLNDREKRNNILSDYGLQGGVGNSEITKGTSPFEGYGTALKPAHEPICMARKPLGYWETKNTLTAKEKDEFQDLWDKMEAGIPYDEKKYEELWAKKEVKVFKSLSVAENVLKYGTGGINIDESRVESKPRLTGTLDKGEEIKAEPTSFKGSGTRKLQTGYDEKMLESNLGRFPANLIHDNSEEVRECFPETGKGNGKGAYNYAGREYNNKETSMFNGDKPQAPSNFNDSGNASRFFKSIIYEAKSPKSERLICGFNCVKLEEWTQQKKTKQEEENTVAEVSLVKVILGLVAPSLSIGGYGNKQTEAYPTDFISTIRTAISKITELKTWNLLIQQPTNDSILAVIKEVMAGINYAEFAVSEKELIKRIGIFQKKITHSTEDVKNATYQSLLKISKPDAWQDAYSHHPTHKPLALMKYLIQMITPPNGIVLDPFAGSGTTGVACHNLKRNFILIEKEPDYCKIAEERLKNLQQTLI